MTFPQTSNPHRPPAPRDPRDLAALACIVVSLVGLGVLALTVDWRLAAAIPLIAVGAVGVLLGIDR